MRSRRKPPPKAQAGQGPFDLLVHLTAYPQWQLCCALCVDLAHCGSEASVFFPRVGSVASF